MHVSITLTTTAPDELKMVADLLKKVEIDESKPEETPAPKKRAKVEKAEEPEEDEDDEDTHNVKAEAEAAAGKKKPRGPYKKKAEAKAEEPEEDETEEDAEDEDEEDAPAPAKKEGRKGASAKKAPTVEDAIGVFQSYLREQKAKGPKQDEKAREHIAKVLKKFGAKNPRELEGEEIGAAIELHQEMIGA